jgi:acyl transferase domain-containing protein
MGELIMGIGTGVAIVGMGCRPPGDNNPNQYWDFMLRRGDGIVEVPAERWNADSFYDADPDAPGRPYARHGGFVTMSPGISTPSCSACHPTRPR